MNKSGWKEVRSRFYAATGLMHDTEQFGNRYRKLKDLWQFIQNLRSDSGLGCRPDGSVVATETWWKNNAQVRLVCNLCLQVVGAASMITRDMRL